ncbi:putative ribonuclease BN [Candidatus Sulfobium mesophilum]|uniref:Putative ribonuclease BN n=1 Tax=Candidatus Sulfobium mesophilum TaxID=2016548 RepID=A0A2U3QJ49_9BACT|nr:putative ribonuclease BN [Candidatus Sulfobium mesophilum]
MEREDRVLRRPGRFILGVFRSFRANQAILLSGAVAYYTLLSVIPMLILTLIALSHFIPEDRLLQIVSTHLQIIIPSYSAKLTEQVKVFLAHRHVVGFVGLLVMLFFSSFAFTVLENAMSVIFNHRVKIQRRHFLISAVIPYIYIILLGIGMLIVSFIAGSLETLEHREVLFLQWRLSLEGASGSVLYILGMIGEVFMLTSVYLVMPVGRITFYHAFVGGISATILWEITRHLLIWYYSTLSLVNIIYGSFAAAVVTLLSIEAAAIILLFCAQVIAELDRKRKRSGKSGFRT